MAGRNERPARPSVRGRRSKYAQYSFAPPARAWLGRDVRIAQPFRERSTRFSLRRCPMDADAPANKPCCTSCAMGTPSAR